LLEAMQRFIQKMKEQAVDRRNIQGRIKR